MDSIENWRYISMNDWGRCMLCTSDILPYTNMWKRQPGGQDLCHQCVGLSTTNVVFDIAEEMIKGANRWVEENFFRKRCKKTSRDSVLRHTQ